MACVSAEITKSLVSDIDGKAIEYNGDIHTMSVDLERINPVDGDHYPMVNIQGPIVEVNSRAAGRCNCTLYYLVLFRDNRINDEPRAGEDIASISEICQNVEADLIKLIMANRTRSGWANNTEYGDFGHFIDVDSKGIATFYAYVTVEVKAMIMDTNPYERG